MAKTHEAVFAQDPQSFGEVLTAVKALDGSDATEIFTAGAEGALISRLVVCPVAAVSTAVGVTIYSQRAGSAVKIPRATFTVPAYAVATTAKLPMLTDGNIVEGSPLRLGSGDKLFAATHATSGGIAVGGEASLY